MTALKKEQRLLYLAGTVFQDTDEDPRDSRFEFVLPVNSGSLTLLVEMAGNGCVRWCSASVLFFVSSAVEKNIHGNCQAVESFYSLKSVS